MKEFNVSLIPHILRNAHLYNEEDVHKAQLQAAGELEHHNGYKEAFYQIAELLGIPAMPISSKEVFDTVMLPKLQALMAIRYGSAFKSGDIVLLRLTKKVFDEELRGTTKALGEAAAATGVKFIVLPEYFDVVEKNPTGDQNA